MEHIEGATRIDRYDRWYQYYSVLSMRYLDEDAGFKRIEIGYTGLKLFECVAEYPPMVLYVRH